MISRDLRWPQRIAIQKLHLVFWWPDPTRNILFDKICAAHFCGKSGSFSSDLKAFGDGTREAMRWGGGEGSSQAFPASEIDGLPRHSSFGRKCIMQRHICCKIAITESKYKLVFTNKLNTNKLSGSCLCLTSLSPSESKWPLPLARNVRGMKRHAYERSIAVNWVRPKPHRSLFE